MYCKFCGKEIDNNSRFCSSCGALQNSSQTSFLNQPNVIPYTHQKIKEIFGFKISKKIVGFYLLWVLMNFVFLIINWDYGNQRDFWPFERRSSFNDYDLTEFLIYTIVPLFAVVIFPFLKGSKRHNTYKSNKYDLSHKKHYDLTIIGIVLLIVSAFFVNLINNVDNNFLNTSAWDPILIIFPLAMRIIITMIVVETAKKLNRFASDWGIFAFILPSIALIVLGQMRKLK